MTRTRSLLVAAVLLAAALAAATLLPAPAHGDTPTLVDRGIVVSGSGSVDAVPDRGSFSFSVVTPAKTAVAALQANGGAAGAVAAALKAAGVAAADLKTTQASLDSRQSPDGQTVTGYVATTSVTAQLPTLARAGAVVDAAVAAGADSFSGPSLSVSDSAALYRDALKAAIADARVKAEAAAGAAKLTLGRITSVEETGATPIPFAAATKADSVVVEPGTQAIVASVTVSFAAG